MQSLAIGMQSVAIGSTHRLLDAPDEERVVAALAQLNLEIEQRGERRGGEAAHEHLWGAGSGERRAVVGACMRAARGERRAGWAPWGAPRASPRARRGTCGEGEGVRAPW